MNEATKARIVELAKECIQHMQQNRLSIFGNHGARAERASAEAFRIAQGG